MARAQQLRMPVNLNLGEKIEKQTAKLKVSGSFRVVSTFQNSRNVENLEFQTDLRNKNS